LHLRYFTRFCSYDFWQKDKFDFSIFEELHPTIGFYMNTNINHTALLVMDIQASIVGMLKEQRPELLPALKTSVEAARSAGIRVIYVVVGFRKGYPEVSAANKAFSTLRQAGRNLDTPEGIAIDSHVAPLGDEVIVVKKRISAFAGSDLELVLRANDIRHIVLTGVSTSGVVLSTLREAADKDFQITLLHDCCADMDAEVHHVLTTKIFPRQAEVMSHTNWAAGLKQI
jgi:nicotinamidase-related amidase